MEKKQKNVIGHSMTIAEVFVFILAAFGIYKALRPVRVYLESQLKRMLKPQRTNKQDVELDKTHYTKKDN